MNDIKSEVVAPNSDADLVRRLMICVLRSKSETQLQQNLKRIFPVHCGLAEVLILNDHRQIRQLAIKPKVGYKILEFELKTEQRDWGGVWIQVDSKHTKKVSIIFKKIIPYIMLNVERWHYLRQAEKMKFQWYQFFSSLNFPIAIYDENEKLFRSNKVFQDFFDPDSYGVSDHPSQKSKYNLTMKKFTTLSGEVFEVRYYQDLFPEKQKVSSLASSELKNDLSIIGASVAHELNNPIGGILNMIQLLLLEQDKVKQPLFSEDLVQMESATKKAQFTIKELLSFAKSKMNASSLAMVSVEDVIQKSTQIVGVQAAGLGIHIQIKGFDKRLFIHGHADGLVQAFVACLQASIFRLEKQKKNLKEKAYKNIIIELVYLSQPTLFEIRIQDSGQLDDKNSDIASNFEFKDKYLYIDFLFRYSKVKLLPPVTSPEGTLTVIKLKSI